MKIRPIASKTKTHLSCCTAYWEHVMSHTEVREDKLV